MISDKTKIIREFILKLVLFTAICIGIMLLIYGGFPRHVSNWSVCVATLMMGYYNAWRWLTDRLKKLSTNERERKV